MEVIQNHFTASAALISAMILSADGRCAGSLAMQRFHSASIEAGHSSGTLHHTEIELATRMNQEKSVAIKGYLGTLRPEHGCMYSMLLGRAGNCAPHDGYNFQKWQRARTKTHLTLRKLLLDLWGRSPVKTSHMSTPKLYTSTACVTPTLQMLPPLASSLGNSSGAM